jgi:glucose/arabinose dehydrogenase
MRCARIFRIALCVGILACDTPDLTSTEDAAAPGDVTAPRDVAVDYAIVPARDASIAHPCTLPGSIQYTDNGVVVVDRLTDNAPDLSFLHLPEGFCLHYFATVGNARQMRFAPGGELFVTSPTTGTTGGGPGGQAAIVVVPDDDHDGVGDAPITFLSNLPSTQGLLFTAGQFYYQDHTAIMSMPYAAGQRAPSANAAKVADITIYSDQLHWPKTLDVADDGSIYVGNGGDQGESCDPARPFHGGLLRLDGTAGGAPVAKGLRNPINVRCWHGHRTCFALELAKDYTASEGGREKMIPIRDGDDWGFPCCATQNLPYADVIPSAPVPDCSTITPDTASFLIGDTPFGLDFEPDKWPAPWTGTAIVATHGAAGSWLGARVVAIAMDKTTGLPVPSTDRNGDNEGGMVDFATGWDSAHRSNGRPAAVTFADDGRLFLANDQNGVIVWIAPISL